jgi:hypothetical protein
MYHRGRVFQSCGFAPPAERERKLLATLTALLLWVGQALAGQGGCSWRYSLLGS